MKNLTLAFFMMLSYSLSAQIYPSNCSTSPLFLSEYQWDIKNIALRQMFEMNSPDTALVTIPQSWQQPVAEGMAAILNAVAMPQRDSIFNLYCIHDKAPATFFIDKEIMVAVDTTFAWTQQWKNLQTMTGNPQIDYLMTKYDLHLVTFYNWSFASVALLGTDSLWNVYALIDSIEQVPGVVYGEPNSMVGTAGRINYYKAGLDRYYEFEFQWNDCFDGCDNTATWRFRVMPDCVVEFIDRNDWGFFGIQPLPAPLNCNLFSGIQQEPALIDDFSLFPNPTEGIVTVKITAFLRSGYVVEVFSGLGERLLTRNCKENESRLDLSGCSPGFYTIRIESAGLSFTRKLAIVR